MQHHLITVAGTAAVEVRGQRGLGQQSERVGSALGLGHLFRGSSRTRSRLPLASQPIASGVERALDDGAQLRREPAANHDHAVVVGPGGQVPVQMPRLASAAAVASSTRARPDQALHLRGGAGLPAAAGLVAGVAPGEGADLHGGADARKRRQRVATRTFSRAAPRSMPVRQCSQCAHDANPPSQPVRWSNSRSSTSSS